FDSSAPMSILVETQQTDITPNTQISLYVNGELRQQALISDMIFSIAEILVELSKLYQLKAGDLIFMGTPAGVAALKPGDVFTAELQGIVSYSGTIF
ncbi:MAG TPA: fumarylacetoacetate hydrolase family protein, partial [Arenimonas sp.]|nr:fumarylacetoacetate hydrolase family protein [Arenimonas sp.]